MSCFSTCPFSQVTNMLIKNAPMEWLSLHRNVGNRISTVQLCTFALYIAGLLRSHLFPIFLLAMYLHALFSYILSASSEVGAVADLVE